MKKHYPIILPFIQALILILIVTCLLGASVVALQVVTITPLRLPSNVLSADFGVRFAVLTSPMITNDGGASGVTDNDATLNGEIASTGNENPIVIVYWGIVDGGTVPAAWTNNHTLGVEPLGAVSHTATDNFTASTMYFYRYYCYNSAGSDWADSTANFTTAGGSYNPPTGLTLTDLGGITVEATWTKSPSANNTLLRISRSGYPNAITAGEWWCFNMDSSVNITGVDLDVMTLYVSAWSELSGNYSATYAYASIGTTHEDGDAVIMTETSVALINGTFVKMFELVLLLGMLFLTFWKKQVFLDAATGLILFFVGLSWIDDYPGISVVLVVFGCYQLFNSIVTTFTAKSGTRGLSQFKEWWHRVKGDGYIK